MRSRIVIPSPLAVLTSDVSVGPHVSMLQSGDTA